MAAALETLQALLATLAEIQELPLNRESRKYFAPSQLSTGVINDYTNGIDIYHLLLSLSLSQLAVSNCS